MAVFTLEWKEPPPKEPNSPILRELQRNPGKWARIATARKSTGCANQWKKLRCEAQTVRTNPGETPALYDLYVRWPEPKRAGGHPDNTRPQPPAAARPVPNPAAVQRASQEATQFAKDRAARGVPEDGKPLSELTARRPGAW